MSTVTDLSRRQKGDQYAPNTDSIVEIIDFCDNQGNYVSASLTALPGGASDNYTLALPGINPVSNSLSKDFINTQMPNANDQVLVASPRCTVVGGKLLPNSPAVFDGKFVGLSSGFYSDFIPINGVPVPYQGSSIAGMVNAAQINVSYMWQRIGDVVTLHGMAVLAGDMPAGTETKYLDVRLPIPLSDNVPGFSGITTYISTTPKNSGSGFKGRGANARDPRFFGRCDMVTSADMNQSNVTQWNNFKIHVWPKEWTRDTFRISWVNSGDNSPDAQFRFTVTYSLAPIMPNGGGTWRYVVDRTPTNTDPGNWD